MSKLNIIKGRSGTSFTKRKSIIIITKRFRTFWEIFWGCHPASFRLKLSVNIMLFHQISYFFNSNLKISWEADDFTALDNEWYNFNSLPFSTFYLTMEFLTLFFLRDCEELHILLDSIRPIFKPTPYKNPIWKVTFRETIKIASWSLDIQERIVSENHVSRFYE